MHTAPRPVCKRPLSQRSPRLAIKRPSCRGDGRDGVGRQVILHSSWTSEPEQGFGSRHSSLRRMHPKRHKRPNLPCLNVCSSDDHGARRPARARRGTLRARPGCGGGFLHPGQSLVPTAFGSMAVGAAPTLPQLAEPMDPALAVDLADLLPAMPTQFFDQYGEAPWATVPLRLQRPSPPPGDLLGPHLSTSRAARRAAPPRNGSGHRGAPSGPPSRGVPC